MLPAYKRPLMGGAIGKKDRGSSVANGDKPLNLPLPGTSGSNINYNKNKKNILRRNNSLSEFSFTDLASSITNRFSVLSGLSFISFVAVPNADAIKHPRSRISRKKWRTSTLCSEYGQCKTVWPVTQTEVLFLPEFPVGIDEKLKLILLGEIGRGAFGQVFHVKCSTTNKEYAMKVLSKAQVCSLDAVRQVKQEVMIQHICSHHPFITPLNYFWQTRKLLIVMTEYIAYGELQQLWRSLRRLPEELLSLYVAEIALALDFLHNAGIIYRDLKMENILLDKDGHIKIIDFGLSRWLSYGGRTNTICGTLQFMAPEILNGEEYGHSVDWWSLGIITYSLLVGHYPVSGFDDHIAMKAAVEKCPYLPPPNASKAMRSLLLGLLQRVPSLRIHSLTMLQKEQMFMRVDFDDVREKKVSPRAVLENYIDGKSRHNFEDFQGLTSTPKRGATHSESKLTPLPSPLLPVKPVRSPLMGGRAIMWDRAKRSSSSPLLSSPLKHPARLGHHDALIKSVSVTGYNGAAVPLLQSPLLRLARGQTVGNRGRKSQKEVSISTLPTAVSPLLVNVRGNRKGRFQGFGNSTRSSEARKGLRENRVIPSPTLPRPGNVEDTKNGTNPKCSSVECMKDCMEKPNGAITRSKTTVSPICCPNLDAVTPPTEDDKSPLERLLQNGDTFDENFFLGLLTSTPNTEDDKKMEFPAIESKPREQSFQTAVNVLSQVRKSSLVNGAVIGNKNFNIPLDEKDLDDTFDCFPWISDSRDP